MSSRPEATPTPTPAATPAKDMPAKVEKQQQRKSLTKFFSRAKTALRRGEASSKRKDDGAAAGSKPAASASASASAATKAVPVTARPRSQQYYASMPGVSRLSKAELFEERAKKLGERFGLEIKASEWQDTRPGETVLRVDKPIRMRVRRTCHVCNASFASAKECPNCAHVRCTKCARYPPKRSEAEVIASRERRAAIIKANRENAPIVPDHSPQTAANRIVLTRPGKNGGQDLVYKKPRQRVRRTCHECEAVFASNSKICAKCNHRRCTDCPRNPSKKDKYPLGYPGDEFGPSSIPHYECVSCKTIYPTGSEHGTPCKKCGVEKSDESPRAKPRKVDPEPDPEVVRSLAEKLEAISVSAT
ncbi:hypothetical protein GMORB2_5494 [Geosmithia morbida]|uniref:Uncharacterized protein n=1 Tax=Geosmithia morbida TaxID=1094350 RepID=A0A9P4YY16_9HYPO|nr:uncharacterized protein GMORB2_5494 [Geosmithia morbida]KAF4123778.1 hypothetical protein GMORB2_5494 [Geosmithia morbida]